MRPTAKPGPRHAASSSLEDAREHFDRQSSRALRETVKVLQRRASSRFDDDPDTLRLEAAMLVLAERQRKQLRTGALVAIVGFLWLVSVMATGRPIATGAVSLAVIAAVVLLARRRG